MKMKLLIKLLIIIFKPCYRPSETREVSGLYCDLCLKFRLWQNYTVCFFSYYNSLQYFCLHVKTHQSILPDCEM
jgi:hypothetical protein